MCRSMVDIQSPTAEIRRGKKKEEEEEEELEMWSNAQRDGRPAEYRWRPLFNAAVWLMPTTRCRAVVLPRLENQLKFAEVPKLVNGSQPLVGRSSP